MLLQIASLWCAYIWAIEAAVLDPALYMIPSPPLSDTGDTIPMAELWKRSAEIRNNEENKNNPSEMWTRSSNTILGDTDPDIAESPTRKRTASPMERAKLFWPRSGPTQYSLGTVQVPLTFGLSGTYGKYTGNVGMGIIGSTYGTVADVSKAAVSALAGSSYGSYGALPGLRIYGRESGVAWSGWGNGKWGHYGKG